MEQTIETPAAKNRSKSLRQAMSDLHIWVGLLAGWILYAMFLTGTVSFFRDEISRYARPELRLGPQLPDSGAVAQGLLQNILQETPASTQVSIALPTERNPAASAFWSKPREPGRRGFESAFFDPLTLERVQARDTRGGDFFFRFHFDFHYIPVLWGRWLAGVCAMFMLVAIVSGVITHKKIFADFFTFRWGKGQRAWLDAHNALSVLGLPFHFMITWSGLVTLMLMYMPWGSDAAFQNRQQYQQEFLSEISSYVQPRRLQGVAADLAPLQPMVAFAERQWGAGKVARVAVNNPGDAAAQVFVVRGEMGRVSYSPYFMEFDGVTGRLNHEKSRVGAAAETRGVLHGLHMGRFADGVTRWLYFLVSLAGTAMVGTGLVLWTVKRRARLPEPHKPYFGLALVERLNIAAIAGLSVAMAGFFWCNRLLALELADRAGWEIHGFFIAWAGALAWALARPPKRAWVELLWLGAALLALLPALNFFATDRHLWNSLRDGDWLFASFDLALLAFAALHGQLAMRTARHQPRAKPQLRAREKTAARPALPAAAASRPAEERA